MHESVRQALSKELIAFTNSLKMNNLGVDVETSLTTLRTAEAVANHFSEVFCVPCPMITCHASTLLEQVNIEDVYLQPGLEKYLHTRGNWNTELNAQEDGLIVVILIEEARPDPSRIKTLLHELIEQVLYIYFDGFPPFSDKQREDWANKFAAFVKMPRNKFLSSVRRCGLDHVKVAEEFQETFSGVSRHFRDLVMAGRPYYFSRAIVETKPHLRCPHQGIEAKLEETKGFCVRIEDAVRTDEVKGKLKKGALPLYNVGMTDQYRVVNPELRPYLETKQPIYIPCLHGASGFGGSCPDLFEEQKLMVLIYPYPEGNCKSRGFYMVAVHPEDGCLLEAQRQNIVAAWRPDIDWIFDWIVANFKRVPDDELEAKEEPQQAIDFWYNAGPEALPSDRTRWPRTSSYADQQTISFNDGKPIAVDGIDE